MTICTSGDNNSNHIAFKAYNYFIEHGTHKHIFKEKEIEVHALTTESAADLKSGEMGKRVEHLESG